MALKISQIREMPIAEAEERVSELKAELAREKALIASGTRSENPGKLKALRRTIARLLTVTNERKKSGLKGKQQRVKEQGALKGAVRKIVKKTKGGEE